ncbi:MULTISPECIES: GNAT family N-acetyltransferase [unclassified Ectothiorhodospira]|uniref:GNAT family N-acetyltransferase n=1 Tax=unclassified Ectothiorhodospira TaxID=2684909 RepID=UPI001EE855D5|nr:MULTISPECIES: GNAT family N-acetyltransferase [unclassified Ectothiorhodospira]MCG5516521.1 ATP-grasp domain-containing protein [Ectothiorhodospira sp. 9100]MCG5519280.1 ATP-grasp domain-containing protein [Ectothiorhodospira sp. 9905]
MTFTENHYRIMPRPRLHDGDLSLRAVGPQDIESIRQWRNAQMDVLRQSAAITPEDQQRYFAEHVWPDMGVLQPQQILLAIERHGQLIGYGGLVHISWPYRRAEISFLLEPHLERDPETLLDHFSRYLLLIQDLAFEDLQLKKLITETYEHRVVHLKGLEAAGHRLEGRLRKHVMVGGQPADALIHGILSHEARSRSPSARDTSVLVTSSSRKVPIIRSLKDAAIRLGQDIQIIAGDTDPMVSTRWEADGFWQMPRLSNNLLTELIEGCRARAISIVLPTRDGELGFWARHRTVLAQAGIEVIVSSPEAIARCRDKLAFALFGRDAHLPIIPAADTPDPFGDAPLVVKERFGAGSRGIGIDLSRDASIEHARGLKDPIFQPFMTGPEISIDGWIDKHGQVAGVVLRRRDRVVSGESQVTTTFRDAVLEKQAMRVLTALQLRGPVVLQAIIVEGALQVIECNPRFGGASTASIAVGLDSLSWSLAEALGDTTTPIFHRAPSEIRQVRVPVDRVLHDFDF